MSWTWDSEQITHDQTCWTYDGYDGCNIAPPVTGGGGGGVTYDPEAEVIDLARAAMDDKDMITILSMIRIYTNKTY